MDNKKFAPGENYDFPLIIKKLLNTPLIYSPNQEIVYADKSRYTYTTLNERIHRLAKALAKLNVESGDTVAVLDYDSHRFLECFFAIPMMGAVLQTVNWRLSAEQILYTINHAGAKVVLINTDFLPVLESMQGQLETVEKVIVLSEEESIPETRASYDAEYETLLASESGRYDFPDLNENTRATTFYTTGTTGLPKGVHFSHRQLVLHTISAALAFSGYHTIGRFRSNDVYMPITPMFHVHAWGFPYIATLVGAKQVYPGKYIPEKLLSLIRHEKVTFSHCVPTILQMLLTSPSAEQTDLSKWKVIIGGARLSKGLAKETRRHGIEVYSGYGMSETCPILTLSLPKIEMLDWDETATLDVIIKTGLPAPLVELEVVNEDDAPVPHDGNSTGEVAVRAPWLTKSYYKDPEKTKELWRNGWLHTGDVGHIDPDGYLQVTDRIKDVIKTGGEWISSLDLENILSLHEAVLESAAIGVRDEKWGERPLMLVVLKPEAREKVTGEALKAFMIKFAQEGKLPKYGVPDRFEFVEQLPKTSVGKLDKKVIRKLYPS